MLVPNKKKKKRDHPLRKIESINQRLNVSLNKKAQATA